MRNNSVLSVFIIILLIIQSIFCVNASNSKTNYSLSVRLSDTEEFFEVINQWISNDNLIIYLPLLGYENKINKNNKELFVKIFEETDERVIFTIDTVFSCECFETIDGYEFIDKYFGEEDQTKGTGYSIYQNGKLYRIAEAVKDGLITAEYLAGILPNTKIVSESNPTEPSSETQVTEPTIEPSAATEPTEASTSAPAPEINETKASVKAGGTVMLKVTNGMVKSWSTSNKAVATVSKGKVTGLKKGTATITAKLSTGKKLNCKVTVTTSPKLSKSSVSIKKGKTVSVKIRGKASTVKNVYTNTKIAKVTSKNTATTIKVKGLKKGKITLKVKVNGVVLKLKVKVK